MNDIKIDKLNRDEIARYLEYKNSMLDEAMLELLCKEEEKLLKACSFRYVYRCFDVLRQDDAIIPQGTQLKLQGESITTHLKGCDKMLLVAGTISAEVDKLLRIMSITDLLKALVYDAMANVAIEQGMEKLSDKLKSIYGEYNHTFRFGIGYGDLSIDIQKDFLQLLNAPKLIGLTVNNSNMMLPTKSITAIIGLSKNELTKKNIDCNDCNLQGNCRFRKRGERCNE